MGLLEDPYCRYGMACVSKWIGELLVVSDIVRGSRWYGWPSYYNSSVDNIETHTLRV